MPIAKSKQMSLSRVLGIFVLGLVSGAQIALYLYDYYDDGIADSNSLLIGIGMIGVSLGFVLYAFAYKRGSAPESDSGGG